MTVLTWEIVDAIAAELGATDANRRKWRQTGRQVPDAWRIRIVNALKARGAVVEFSAFDDLPPRPGKLSSHADANIGGAPAPAPGKRRNGSPRAERSGTNG